jgi:hypothetical protein
MILIEAMFNAPLIAVDPEQPDALHAATMEAVCHGWKTGTVESACGVDGLKLLSQDGEKPIPWPPAVRGLKPMLRCPVCQARTGRRKPRCRRPQ